MSEYLRCPACACEDPPGPVERGNARESMKCPRCGATCRHRAVAAAVTAVEGTRGCLRERLTGRRVWELGASPLSRFLDGSGLYVRSELRPAPGAVVQDLEATTWPDNRFDLVVCSDVLEHVRLHIRAIMEIARVLAPGGVAVLTVPDTGEYQPRPHREFCFLRAWAEQDEWAPDAPLHDDPLDPAGCRVYRYYNLPHLVDQLYAYGGLVSRITERDLPEFGVVNCPVIVATKGTVPIFPAVSGK